MVRNVENEISLWIQVDFYVFEYDQYFHQGHREKITGADPNRRAQGNKGKCPQEIILRKEW
jgi:hypothetical protein